MEKTRGLNVTKDIYKKLNYFLQIRKFVKRISKAKEWN